MAHVVNEVHADSNWRNRVRTENTTSARFANDWGFLATTGTPEHMNAPHATATVKYYTGVGRYTVKQVKVPLSGKAAADAVAQQEALLSLSATFDRPRNALESTVFSHTKRMGDMAERSPAFEPTSTVYGSRHTLEQFGVSEFGVRNDLTQPR